MLVLSALAIVAAHAASPVEIAQSERRPVVQVVSVSGTVTSPQSAILSPSIGGLVEKTLVDAGDRVEAGAIVVTLDSELARLTLERTVAEETQARIALDDAKRRLAERGRGGRRGGPGRRHDGAVGDRGFDSFKGAAQWAFMSSSI